MTSAVKHKPQSNLTVYGVMHTHINQVWREVEPLLLRALEYDDGKYNAQDIYDFLKNREMQLFVCMRHGVVCSFGITQIVNYPRKKVLFILFAAGVDLHEWPDYEKHFTDWARDEKCDAIEITGRKGWARVVRNNGYTESYTVVRKNL